MLLYARKKFLRDERVLQLVLLLSLLRGDPDSLLGSLGAAPLADDLPHDLILGSSLGYARPSSPMNLGADLHPKNMDRILADYQRSVLEDLNALGRYSWRPPPAPVQAFLLNSHTSFPSPPSADTPDHHQPAADPASQPSHLLSDSSATYDISDDLTPEDLALIEALWKQDVDLGVPREVYEDDGTDGHTDISSKDKDHGKKPKSNTTLDEKPDDNLWLHLNYTVDSETGEQLLSPENHISGGDVALDSVSPLNSPSFTLNETVPDLNLDFNLDEALKFVGLNCSETGETVWKPSESEPSSEAQESPDKEDSDDSLDTLNDTLDDMIQASQLHPQHPRSLQGRLGSLVRGGEMERWQEVVQYLGLPNPHHTQAPHTPMAAHGASPNHSHGHGPPLHHPHALYPSHETSPPTPAAPVPRGVLLNNATLPPPMPDPMTHNNITYTNSMGASSHLVTSSMNLTNSSDLAGSDHSQYKMEATTTLPSEMMYYQNRSLGGFELNATTDRLIADVLSAENTSTEMNQTTDGLLSSILNDEALGLMEMAMSDSGCALPQLSGEEGVDVSSDSAVSSLSPDEPWSSLDHTTQPPDSGSRNQSGDYNNTGTYRYAPEEPHRMPPIHLKKQHMFGRGGAAGGLGGGSSSGVGNVGGYGNHYAQPPSLPTMEGATALDPAEMKYSCTMDFRSQEVSGSAVEHVQHNHTYHMSPEGPSGLSRPTSRDKQKNRS